MGSVKYQMRRIQLHLGIRTKEDQRHRPSQQRKNGTEWTHPSMQHTLDQFLSWATSYQTWLTDDITMLANRDI